MKSILLLSLFISVGFAQLSGIGPARTSTDPVTLACTVGSSPPLIYKNGNVDTIYTAQGSPCVYAAAPGGSTSVLTANGVGASGAAGSNKLTGPANSVIGTDGSGNGAAVTGATIANAIGATAVQKATAADTATNATTAATATTATSAAGSTVNQTEPLSSPSGTFAAYSYIAPTGGAGTGPGATQTLVNNQTVNILLYGAVSDVVVKTALSTVSGSPTVTISGLTTADQGKAIVFYDPNLTTGFQSTISTVVGTTVTLSTNADITASGRTAYYATDSTLAINKAASRAIATGKPLYIPAGNFFYSPSANSTTAIHGWSSPVIYGDGQENAFIYLGHSDSFVDDNQAWQASHFHDFQIYGGFAQIRNRFTGANVLGQQKTDHMIFTQFFASGWSVNSSDMPNVVFTGNTLYGVNTINTIGYANLGSDSMSVLEANAFLNQRIAAKFGSGGTGSHFIHNDCLQFNGEAVAGSYMRACVWYVPLTAQSGYNSVNKDNKYGPENLDTADVRVLLADTIASSGNSYFGETLWLTSASTGFINGVQFDSSVSGSGGVNNPVFYSYTPNFNQNKINVTFSGAYPTFLLQFDAGVTCGSGTNQMGVFLNTGGTIVGSNCPSYGFVEYIDVATHTIQGRLAVAPVAPASVAGNGTAAGTSLTITGAAGGATSGATGQTGGTGAALSITAGAGGAAPSGSTNGTGGNVTMNAGAPGAGAGTAGVRGSLLFQSLGGTSLFGVGSATTSATVYVRGTLPVEIDRTSGDSALQWDVAETAVAQIRGKSTGGACATNGAGSTQAFCWDGSGNSFFGTTKQGEITAAGLAILPSYTGTGTATFAPQTGAGTGATAVCATSHVCDSFSGEVTLTSGSVGTPATGSQLIITLPITRTNQPNCSVDVYGGTTFLGITKTQSTSTITISAGVALTFATTYTVDYVCGGN